ncbi:amidohydrolase family protein [Aeromicrobium sp. YIM 150415]|uniref:metal-dependent hydrolase family protein n=1 Tax=Aeromicrobium sp. YIM 150415 TaxID=2803912 RepID=UPI001966C1DF|nr:amidohydrolase family protein [Aeromicrobium sp. YIM 150415]MBM9463713.1 amidohydrolase family protein [Aeromicrobium sp. YIM 150415]
MSILIENALILTGDADEVIENGSVLVEGQQIVEVGPTVTPSANAQRIDATGATVVPGLFNMHDHIARKRLRISDRATTYRAQGDILMRQPLPFLALHSAANVLAQLRSGVTFIRDFGLPGLTGIQTARAIAENIIPGPTVLSGGDPICITGGHSSNWGAMEADGPVGVRTAVRQQLINGAGVLKFMGSGGLGTYPEEDPGIPELTPEELEAGISEAHKFHKRTATHAYSTEAILNAVRAGTDTIEHGAFLTPESVREMVEHGTALVPTLSSVIAIGFQHRLIGNDHMYQRIMDDIVGAHMESVRLAWEAGVPIGAGTDTSGEVVEELELIAEATGAGIVDVLRTATATAARIAGVEDVRGRIVPGMRADLLIADGHLLDEGWEVLRRPRQVFKDGASHDGQPMPFGVRLGQLRGLLT